MSLRTPPRARRLFLLLPLGLLLTALAFGCRRAQPGAPPPEKPTVPVSHPVRREVTDFVDYTGRTAAVVREADAGIKAAPAAQEAYKLNLEFPQVRSPIDGQVGRVYYTLGNLVTQDSTLLTTVVSLDPVYGYFDVDERTVLRVRNAI